MTTLDAPSEVFPTGLRYLGLPTGSQSEEDLAKVEALVMSLRPSIKYFHSSQYINDLANGEICLVMGWSGDVFIARDRAEEAANNNEIAYFIPREGALMWFDTIAMPKDAPHVVNTPEYDRLVTRTWTRVKTNQ